MTLPCSSRVTGLLKIPRRRGVPCRGVRTDVHRLVAVVFPMTPKMGFVEVIHKPDKFLGRCDWDPAGIQKLGFTFQIASSCISVWWFYHGVTMVLPWFSHTIFIEWEIWLFHDCFTIFIEWTGYARRYLVWLNSSRTDGKQYVWLEGSKTTKVHTEDSA